MRTRAKCEPRSEYLKVSVSHVTAPSTHFRASAGWHGDPDGEHQELSWKGNLHLKALSERIVPDLALLLCQMPAGLGRSGCWAV